MSDQEFHFLEAYAKLCLKYNIIITADSGPHMCQVMTKDIPLHLGVLFCPDPWDDEQEQYPMLGADE